MRRETPEGLWYESGLAKDLAACSGAPAIPGMAGVMVFGFVWTRFFSALVSGVLVALTAYALVVMDASMSPVGWWRFLGIVVALPWGVREIQRLCIDKGAFPELSDMQVECLSMRWEALGLIFALLLANAMYAG